MVHKLCEKCRWNNYPVCTGTIMFDGSEMNIENLRPGFNCGQKDSDTPTDLRPRKTDLELRVEALEEAINELSSSSPEK